MSQQPAGNHDSTAIGRERRSRGGGDADRRDVCRSDNSRQVALLENDRCHRVSQTGPALWVRPIKLAVDTGKQVLCVAGIVKIEIAGSCIGYRILRGLEIVGRLVEFEPAILKE